MKAGAQAVRQSRATVVQLVHSRERNVREGHEVTSVFRTCSAYSRSARGWTVAMSSLASHVVERSSWLVQLAAAGRTRRKPRADAVSGGAQSIRKLRRPTGLFRAGNGVWRSATWRHTFDLSPGRARRDPSYDLTGEQQGYTCTSKSQVEPAWLGAGTREK